MYIKENKNILFFELDISGHHVEYLYHLISYQNTHSNGSNIILITHPEIHNKLKEFDLNKDWHMKGLKIIYPSQEEMRQLSQTNNVFKRAKLEFYILRKIVKKYDMQYCCFMSLNKYQFVLGGFWGRMLPCGFRGILFNPLGVHGNSGKFLLTKLRKHLQILWMIKNRRLEHIYILNDEDLAKSLNKRYHRSRLFISLPDPIMIPPTDNSNGGINLPTKTTGKKRFLLFGSLSVRKGIFLVLDALEHLPKTITQKVEFIFAGKIIDQSEIPFLKSLDILKNKKPDLHIFILNRFVPYTAIPDLFSSSDCILVPYTGNQASSGILGHAALYRKPVIGPDRGLISKLIRSYKLGTTFKVMDARKLADSIASFIKNDRVEINQSEMDRFIKERHPNRFVETLMMQ
jgi:glycosyltransferase involved in cell wall biosynthesis